MSLFASVFPEKSALVKLFSVATIGLTVGATSAFGAVPNVVIDAQQTIGQYFNNPQSIAINGTNQNAAFIADTNNNQIIALLHGYNYNLVPTGFTLSSPNAVALDSKGDLFIADAPSNNGTTVGRILEMTADSTGNLTGAAQLVFSGSPLQFPTALTVDNNGTLFIGDYPSSGAAALYSLTPGGAPQLLTITNGPPTQWFNSALLRDSGNNLYFADNGNLQGSNGAVYVVPTSGGAATMVATPGFQVNQPTGLALDAMGNFFILTLLGTGSGYNAGQQILVLPAASPSTPYIFPSSGINTGSGMAFDGNGYLDVADSFNNNVVQLSYGTALNMGQPNVGSTGPQFTFNFEFNAPATLRGFQVTTQGDNSTDLTQVSGGNCANGAHNNLANHGPAVSAMYPYTCTEIYQATPQFPGTRTSAILVKGPNSTILGSQAVYQVGNGSAQVTYPLNATSTATSLQQPQAVAISGQNKTVYIADTQAGKVYSTSGLGGSATTQVSTGNIALSAPIGLALDGAGNLYIADYNLGEVVEVPTATGAAPSVVNTGGLLKHPVSLTVDQMGNIYIGDGGSDGFAASYGNPGYIVKVPAYGAPFKMPITQVQIVFPQALTTDIYTNNLYVGDGGDLSGVGQVDDVQYDGKIAYTLQVNNVTNPTGLAFDPAGDLYILDGFANTITVDPIYPNNQTQYLLPFDNTLLSAPSSMAISPGGQSFVIANIGTGSSNTLVRLNGNRSTLAFGKVKDGTQSQPLTASVTNIGNANLVLGQPYYSSTTANNAFSILNSSTCTDTLSINTGANCSINFEFSPAAAGQTTQQFTINSNAYNTGTPILQVQGTGSANGNSQKGKN